MSEWTPARAEDLLLKVAEAHQGRLDEVKTASALPNWLAKPLWGVNKNHLLSEETPEHKAALEKAEHFRTTIAKRLNVTPYLAGSLATGLNVPGKFDFDYGVRVTSKPKLLALVNRLEKSKDFTASQFNKPNADYHVFTTQIGGESVDLAILYGDKAKQHRAGIEDAKKLLTEAKRREIVGTKAEAGNMLFMKDKRYKAFKSNLDKQLGVPHFGRDDLSKAAAVSAIQSINRKDVFGQRTHDLTPLLNSNMLISAVDAAKRGALKSVEKPGWNRGVRIDPEPGQAYALRKEIFLTPGLLPPDAGYGQYGVLFRAKDVAKSPYINTIPDEHVRENAVKSKLHFVVPDHEFEMFTKKYQQHSFIRESELPEKKKLPSTAGIIDIASRIFRGPSMFQKTEGVTFRKKADGEFKLEGHTDFQGLPIAIEQQKGSVRSGVDKDGHKWRTVMKLPYGYIKGSKGADGEGVDVYVGPKKDAENAYVVHQNKADGSGYDEDKVMLGQPSKEKAIKAYLKHYDDPKFLGPVKEVPMERLKELIESGKTLKKISSVTLRAMREMFEKEARSAETMHAVGEIANRMRALPTGTRTMLNTVALAKGMDPHAAFQLAEFSHGGQGVHGFLAGLPETAHLPSQVRDLGKAQAVDKSLAGLKDMKIDLDKGGLVGPKAMPPRPVPGARPAVRPVVQAPVAAPVAAPMDMPALPPMHPRAVPRPQVAPAVAAPIVLS